MKYCIQVNVRCIRRQPRSLAHCELRGIPPWLPGQLEFCWISSGRMPTELLDVMHYHD